MNKFNIGDKVMCVDTRWAKSVYAGLIVPQKGKIYTIRNLNYQCCRLLEIVNYTVSQKSNGSFVRDPQGEEPQWYQWHFAKYDEIHSDNILEEVGNVITKEYIASQEVEQC